MKMKMKMKNVFFTLLLIVYSQVVSAADSPKIAEDGVAQYFSLDWEHQIKFIYSNQGAGENFRILVAQNSVNCHLDEIDIDVQLQATDSSNYLSTSIVQRQMHKHSALIEIDQQLSGCHSEQNCTYEITLHNKHVDNQKCEVVFLVLNDADVQLARGKHFMLFIDEEDIQFSFSEEQQLEGENMLIVLRVVRGLVEVTQGDFKDAPKYKLAEGEIKKIIINASQKGEDIIMRTLLEDGDFSLIEIFWQTTKSETMIELKQNFFSILKWGAVGCLLCAFICALQQWKRLKQFIFKRGDKSRSKYELVGQRYITQVAEYFEENEQLKDQSGVGDDNSL